MYLTHYNLRIKPFETSPDPKFLWLSEKHKEALASLKYGIQENKGFLLLTGDIGTGKTTLINCLLNENGTDAIIASIPDPELSIADFFKLLSKEFNLPIDFDTKADFLIQFENFLHNTYSEEKKALLIIDEAQRLNQQLLEQIRLLSNIERQDVKLINIFFVGQNELYELILDEQNKALRQRITVHYSIEPLTESETRDYIKHRLRLAGSEEEIFSPEAIYEIFSFSKGYPRLINSICDHALLIGYSKELKLIDDSVIVECKKDLHILSGANKFQDEDYGFEENQELYEFSKLSKKEQVGKRIWIYVSFTLIFIIIGYILFNFVWRDSSSIEIKESRPSLKNGFSEKESLKSEDVIKGDFDKEKVSQNNQMGKTAALDKIDETRKKSVLSAAQGDDQTEELTSSEDIFSLPERKPIIQFEHGSMKLPDEAYEVLDQIVKFSSSNPVSEIIVEGYTDSLGSYIYNKNLSKSRADVIKKYLVDKGIPATKIETFGMGPENPIASNETFEGRKLNRRIEIKIKVK